MTDTKYDRQAGKQQEATTASMHMKQGTCECDMEFDLLFNVVNADYKKTLETSGE